MNTSLKDKFLRWVPLVLAAVLVAAAAYILLTPDQTDGLAMENNAIVGEMPGIDPAARLAQMQEELDESRIAFSINTSPAFANGRAEGQLMLENPANNAKLIKTKIVLDATGETLYESGALRPGSYLDKVRLSKFLPKGVYPATAYFIAYREGTHELIGQTGAAITISVLA